MAGRMVDFKRQAVNYQLAAGGPVLVDLLRLQRQQLGAHGIHGVHIDGAAGGLFQRRHRADVVVVAVGQQDMGQRGVLGFQGGEVGFRCRSGVDEDAVPGVGGDQKRVGIQRRQAVDVLDLHKQLLTSSTRRCQ